MSEENERPDGAAVEMGGSCGMAGAFEAAAPSCEDSGLGRVGGRVLPEDGRVAGLGSLFSGGVESGAASAGLFVPAEGSSPFAVAPDGADDSAAGGALSFP